MNNARNATKSKLRVAANQGLQNLSIDYGVIAI